MLKCEISSLEKNCSSVSKTSSKGSSIEKKHSSHASKESLFFDDMKKMKLPFELINILRQLYRDISFYAHQYTSEVCSSLMEDIMSIVKWEPNMTCDEEDENEMLRDWRGRCITTENFRDKILSNNETSHPSGAPLISLISQSNGSYLVNCLSFPLCPMEEAFKGTMYTTSEDSEKNFIGQAAIILLKSKYCGEVSSELCEKIFNYSVKSSQLLIRFQNACRQAISTRKNKCKELYFTALGYSLVTKGTQKGLSLQSLKDFLSNKKINLEEAYRKLYRKLENGTRDTNFWRLAPFSDICTDDNRDENELETRKDHLFVNEPARIAFKAFRKYDLGEKGDASIMSLIRFDAVMTRIIDSFKDLISQIDIQLDEINQKIQSSDRVDERNKDNDVIVENGVEKNNNLRSLSKNNSSEICITGKLKTRGGSIPTESTKQLKKILPVAAAQALNQVLQIFKRKLSGSKFVLSQELSVQSSGSEKDRLGNNERKYTYAFRHPENNRYYISLTAEAFTKLICPWYGAVSDCFVLQSKKLYGPYLPFKEDNPYSVLHDSDSEGEDEENNLGVRYNPLNNNDIQDESEYDEDEKEEKIKKWSGNRRKGTSEEEREDVEVVEDDEEENEE